MFILTGGDGPLMVKRSKERAPGIYDSLGVRRRLDLLQQQQPGKQTQFS